MTRKKVLFLTGTRADYGKMKSLMKALGQNSEIEIYVFVCGMHLLETFGSMSRESGKTVYKIKIKTTQKMVRWLEGLA